VSADLVPAAAGAFPAGSGDRLALLDAAADAWLAGNIPENTRRAWEQDWRVWTEFCDAAGLPHLPATAGALVAYVRWLSVERGAAPATIDRRLAGVVVGHRRRAVELPRDVKDKARQAYKAEQRRLAEAAEQRGRGKARPLTVRELRTMVDACPAEGPAGCRDRALLLLGFPLAARRSELAHLRVSDVETAPEGLVVTIRFAKTGGRVVAVPRGQNPRTCPVRAWQAWLAVRGTEDGPAFLRVDRHGRMPGGLTAQGVGRIVARAADRAGLDPATGHSLRAGLATEARRAGHDARAIAEQGGWSPTSSVLYGYMRVVDRWTDNAVVGIGM
jgi:integrase